MVGRPPIASQKLRFDWRDLEWPRRHEWRVSTAGTPYLSWVPDGMPRVPVEYLHTAFFLYDSAEDAQRGVAQGGTGFLVGVPLEDMPNAMVIYGVSNRHVVRDGSSVVRLNLRDGGTDIIPFEPHEWHVHPDGDDLAIIHFGIDDSRHACRWVDARIFVKQDDVGDQHAEVTVGDDVFQIGRFALLDEQDQNQPTARFGNVSTGLVKATGRRGHAQESLGVEVHSISGYSGSPVFTMRNVVGIGPVRRTPISVRLLGVCWAHIPLDEKVMERIVRVQENGMRHDERVEQYVNLNSGMDLVVPAWKLTELLYEPKQVEYRRELAKTVAARRTAIEDSPSVVSASSDASLGPNGNGAPPQGTDPEVR